MLKSNVVGLNMAGIGKIRLLKFGDGDGPNLCRVKKVYVSSGLTLISS